MQGYSSLFLLALQLTCFCQFGETAIHLLYKLHTNKGNTIPMKKTFNLKTKLGKLVCATKCFQNSDCSYFLADDQHCRGYVNMGEERFSLRGLSIIQGKFERYIRNADVCPRRRGYIFKNICFKITPSKQTFDRLIVECIVHLARPAIIKPASVWSHTSLFKKGNVARGRPTKQDSTYSKGVSGRKSLSSLALDGVEDTNWYNGHCSATNDYNTTHWWQVDTGQSHVINSVDILPRSDGPGPPGFLAGDPNKNLLFMAFPNQNEIWSINMNGTNPMLIVSAPAFGLAVDTYNGVLYWAEQSSNSIKKIDVDGNNVTVVLENAPSPPSALDIDFDGQMLYWCGRDGKVHGLGLNTGVKTSLPGPPSQRCISLRFCNDFVYITYTSIGGIRKVALDGTIDEFIFESELPNVSSMFLSLLI